jgi:glucose-1-phosphatase
MAKKTALRALIWDMGGVLVRNMHPDVRTRLGQPFGLDSRGFENLFFGNPVAAQASIGKATEADAWEYVRRELKIDADQMPALIRNFWSADQFDEELYAFSQSLRPGIKVGLLSNAFPEARSSLGQRFPKFFDMFDVSVFSAEVGMAKPEPRIYKAILERLDVAPQEAVFVDDFIENVEGARAVGMQAVHFRNAHQAVQELEALLG